MKDTALIYTHISVAL